MELMIDPEFQTKIPPLTDEEFRLLEENIVAEGRLLMPIEVWGKIIVDGHNRYQILQKHPEIEMLIHQREFSNRYEAIVWICKNQLGRRNLSEVNKRYVVGKQYEAEKLLIDARTRPRDEKGYFQPIKENDPWYTPYTMDEMPKSDEKQSNYEEKERTRDIIAKQIGMSPAYVSQAEKFAQGIDQADEIEEGFRDKVLAGELKVFKKDIERIAKADPEQKVEIVQEILEQQESSVNANCGRKRRNKQLIPQMEPESEPEDSWNKPSINSQIEAISKGMESSAGAELATIDDMLYEMEHALDDMIWRWNNCKESYPRPLKNRRSHERIRILAQRGVTFLLQVKKGELWK